MIPFVRYGQRAGSTAALLVAAALVVSCGSGASGRTIGAAGATTPTPVHSAERVKTIPAGPYTPGVSYFGRAGYIEYIPGTLPLIISAPHGGTLVPAEIPDRKGGTTVTDSYTDLLAKAVADAFQARTGKRPHLIITHLKRIKIDTNRDSAEGTEGNPFAVTAWFEFHDFMEVARQTVNKNFPAGFYLDLHGQGHPIHRLELGYLITSAELNKSDASLDSTPLFEQKSSIRRFSEQSPLSFSALLRGPSSFGARFAAEGYPSVPSPQSLSPDTAAYFDGGYNTARYGCAVTGTICSLQIESNLAGVRDTPASRTKFATAVAKVVDEYLRANSTIRLTPP